MDWVGHVERVSAEHVSNSKRRFGVGPVFWPPFVRCDRVQRERLSTSNTKPPNSFFSAMPSLCMCLECLILFSFFCTDVIHNRCELVNENCRRLKNKQNELKRVPVTECAGKRKNLDL